MNQSATIGALAAALAKAQGEMEHAVKNKVNPFFNSKYADLAAIFDCIRGPLAKNGLSISQPLGITEHGGIYLETKLLHSSGEWIGSTVPIISAKQDAQAISGVITYMKRVSVSALMGVATEDDQDGNDAQSPLPVPAPGAYDNYKAAPLKPSGNASPVKPATNKPITREENDFFG
jgi:hypothetical protein